MHNKLNSLVKYLMFPLIAFFVCYPVQANSKPVVIYHSGISSEELSRNSLVRLYGMQKKVWQDGSPVKVFILPKNSSVHKKFVLTYLRMQPYQLNRLWHRLLFSGTGSVPEEVSSIEEIIEKVNSTPGAVGYIDDSSLSKINNLMIRSADYE